MRTVLPPPAGVEPEGHHPVHQVVAGGDRVEHRPDHAPSSRAAREGSVVGAGRGWLRRERLSLHPRTAGVTARAPRRLPTVLEVLERRLQQLAGEVVGTSVVTAERAPRRAQQAVDPVPVSSPCGGGHGRGWRRARRPARAVDLGRRGGGARAQIEESRRGERPIRGASGRRPRRRASSGVAGSSLRSGGARAAPRPRPPCSRATGMPVRPASCSRVNVSGIRRRRRRPRGTPSRAVVWRIELAARGCGRWWPG